jgi:hypothetical protein
MEHPRMQFHVACVHSIKDFWAIVNPPLFALQCDPPISIFFNFFRAGSR